ncbi:putative gustatory receptor 47b isoform X1 [Bactrocera neohumeralis]|uniref:putative gustatory receptor 47b isoform X1 n=2 Tax=Bactrocera neohumeralis TaxID=98809 RepID=UPI00216660DD|nr:putative gustatory receptor 47b isoform X1 [Bactrocera neohumeralis]
MKVLTKRIKNVSLYCCFEWIYMILYYTGCLCFQLRGESFQLTKANIIYTNFIQISLIFGFLGSVLLKYMDDESYNAMFNRLSPVFKFILVLECFVSAMTYIAVCIKMQTNKYKHLKFLREFKELDAQMQIDFNYIKWNYHKTMRKFTIFTLIGMTYYYTVSFIYIFKLSNCNCDYVTTFVFALSYASITLAPSCIFFLHLGKMDLLRIRYRLIKRLLKQQYALAVDLKHQHKFEMRISRLIDYCKSYIQLILQVNDVFGVVSGFSLFHDFAMLTNMTFLMCQKATETKTTVKEYIFIILFMLPRIYKVIIYAVYGYVTQRERRDCTHEVRMCERYLTCSKAAHSKLEAFLHWQMQNTYSFLVGKVTTCNLFLLYATVNSIASSVLILIQLQFQQNSITNRMKNQQMLKDIEFI